MKYRKPSALLASLSLMLLVGCSNQNSLGQQCKRVESILDNSDFQEGVLVSTEASVASKMANDGTPIYLANVLIEGASESTQAELPLAQEMLSKLQGINVTDPEMGEYYQTYVSALETYINESQKAVEMYAAIVDAGEAAQTNATTDAQEQVLETALDDLQAIHVALETPSKQMQETRVDISIHCIAAVAE